MLVLSLYVGSECGDRSTRRHLNFSAVALAKVSKKFHLPFTKYLTPQYFRLQLISVIAEQKEIVGVQTDGTEFSPRAECILANEKTKEFVVVCVFAINVYYIFAFGALRHHIIDN